MNDINFICALLDINGNDLIRDTERFDKFFIDKDILFHCLFKYNDIPYEVIIRYSNIMDEYVFYLILDNSIVYYCFNTDYNDLLYYKYKDIIKEHFNNAVFFK